MIHCVLSYFVEKFYTFAAIKNNIRMQILLANAKLMFDQVTRTPWSTPRFQQEAEGLAAEMARMDPVELARQLDCSSALAAENWLRFQQFPTATPRPALFAYNGQAYKHLRADTLTEEALRFGQDHLWITCFLYGLLRPMDGIVPYRMEHCVTLEQTADKPIPHFWRRRLTDLLIACVQADDGILVHLSTAEYEQLFDWKRVRQTVRVIQPLFYVRKQGKLRMQAVWAKSCRGAMVHFLLQNQVMLPEEIQAFDHAGFQFDPTLGETDYPHFVRDDL